MERSVGLEEGACLHQAQVRPKALPLLDGNECLHTIGLHWPVFGFHLRFFIFQPSAYKIGQCNELAHWWFPELAWQ